MAIQTNANVIVSRTDTIPAVEIARNFQQTKNDTTGPYIGFARIDYYGNSNFWYRVQNRRIDYLGNSNPGTECKIEGSIIRVIITLVPSAKSKDRLFG